jgi:hypothetical protein
MSSDFHISALRKGIAVAVETGDPFSAELVEVDAASSIRWNGEPPPPQIVVACSLKNRQEHFLSKKRQNKRSATATCIAQ